MKIKKYHKLNETIYTHTFSNGFKLRLIPKKGYYKTFVCLNVNFGSYNTLYLDKYKNYKPIPLGSAHFLEHKLFAQSDGTDAFSTFSELGANANAFTTFDKTSYIFSTTQNFDENLSLLLNFVNNPFFTTENVEKEKEIISSEIKMYMDNPDSYLYYGLLNQIFPKSNVSTDIAGTCNSISHITPEILLDIYNTFYVPNNMSLNIVGNISDVSAIVNVIHDNISNIKKIDIFDDLYNVKINPIKGIYSTSNKKYMNIIQKKSAFAWTNCKKGNANSLKQYIAKRVAIRILFGKHTQWQLDLLKNNIIKSELDMEFFSNKLYDSFYVFNEGSNSEKLYIELSNRIKNRNKIFDELSVSEFNTIVQAEIGEFISNLNSLNYIALNDYFDRFDETLLEEYHILTTLEKNDLKTALDDFFSSTQFNEYHILPTNI